MFTPIGSSIIPVNTSLVATPLPNSVALRVPSDNVSPSVSSAQLDNNASPNVTVAQQGSIAPLPIPVQSNSGALPAPAAANSFYSAGAEFLAQLASSDMSQEAEGVLRAYEKLVSYESIKYKPSNAGKPVSPASMFGSLMVSNKPASKAEAKAEPRTTENKTNAAEAQIAQIQHKTTGSEKSFVYDATHSNQV